MTIILISLFIYRFINTNTIVSNKHKGGYAIITNSAFGNDSSKGTWLRFIPTSLNKPIAIECSPGNNEIDVSALTTDLVNAIGNQQLYPRLSIENIRNAVRYPGDQLTRNAQHKRKLINGIISSNILLSRWIWRYDEDCDLDYATNIILPGVPIANIRRNISTLIQTTGGRYIALELTEAYQGNIQGNAAAGNHFIAYDGTRRLPRYRETPRLVHPGSRIDPFKANVLNNDHFRGWYGKINSRVNPQYVRHSRVNANIYELLYKPPDHANDKQPTDEMADIIPAGTVRVSIMLLLRAWLDNNNGLTVDDLYDMIAYITLLAGLANAYGNTTHDSAYNKSIGDTYGRVGTQL